MSRSRSVVIRSLVILNAAVGGVKDLEHQILRFAQNDSEDSLFQILRFAQNDNVLLLRMTMYCCSE